MAGKPRKIASPSAAAYRIDSIHHREKGSEEKCTGVGTGCTGIPPKSSVYLQTCEDPGVQVLSLHCSSPRRTFPDKAENT